MGKVKAMNGGAQDPDRYKYTRAYAGASLGALVGLLIFLVVSIAVKPELADAYAKISGLLGTGLVTLGGIIGAWMGLSNKWGRADDMESTVTLYPDQEDDVI